MRRFRERKLRARRIARERIRRLLRLANETFKEDLSLAERYGELARKISIRCRVPIPAEWRWRYCRHCKTLLFPGSNAIIRTRSESYPHITIKCQKCGKVNRRPYLREKKGLRMFKIRGSHAPRQS